MSQHHKALRCTSQPQSLLGITRHDSPSLGPLMLYSCKAPIGESDRRQNVFAWLRLSSMPCTQKKVLAPQIRTASSTSTCCTDNLPRYNFSAWKIPTFPDAVIVGHEPLGLHPSPVNKPPETDRSPLASCTLQSTLICPQFHPIDRLNLNLWHVDVTVAKPRKQSWLGDEMSHVHSRTHMAHSFVAIAVCFRSERRRVDLLAAICLIVRPSSSLLIAVDMTT
jgi:hypothetical protein